MQIGKKSQNRNISPTWGEAPAKRVEMKICNGVDLVDAITDVKYADKLSLRLI